MPTDGAALGPARDQEVSRARTAPCARPSERPPGAPQPAAEMHSPPGLLALWLCAALCASASAGSDPQPGPGRPACPAPCHCQEDGIMLSADCSELGLSVVPADLDPLTAYL